MNVKKDSLIDKIPRPLFNGENLENRSIIIKTKKNFSLERNKLQETNREFLSPVMGSIYTENQEKNEYDGL